ncbi:MAG: SUMF1/EgtB/PvdO family nonheme iron enzyme [Chloroflexi bacterium]|nr:SUMF1/EgtB/PvdO family nonheme iron enzyme [Chloroflexota bacterium]
MDYLDFELEVRPLGGQQYELVVIKSPAGEAREQATFPLDTLQRENRLKDVEIALLRSGKVSRKTLTEEEQNVQNFGRQLFDFLLPGELRGLYRTSLSRARQDDKGLRLKLRLADPDLANLPWEFLYDAVQSEYLCLAHETPLVRYVELERTVPPLAVVAPLRVLGMVASPTNLPHQLDIGQEQQRVEEALADLQAQGLVELHWLAGQTWRDLQRVLRGGSWHVFHFIGHGGFDTYKDEGFLLLADERGEAKRFYATELGRLLAGHRPLRLALLNACEGAKGGRDIFSSTARILMGRGLPAVLAMQYEISDTAAIEFARTFYEALAEGLPVDRATAEARIAVSLAFERTVEWGIPVLSMRSADGVLFGQVQAHRPTPPTQAVEEKPAPPLPALELALPSPQPHPEFEQLTQDAQTPRRLYELLVARFSMSELKTLAFGLSINYENIGHKTLSEFALELVQYCQRRGRLGELMAQIQQECPDVAVGSLLTEARRNDLSRAVPPVRSNDFSRSVPPTETLEQERTAKAVTTNPLGIEWIEIPAGEFWMGEGSECHLVNLPTYWIAKTPLTNTQYHVFVQATGHPAPEHWENGQIPEGKGNHPVVLVDWDDGIALAKWASEQTGQTILLPSEAEWEKAARGGLMLPNGKNPLPKRIYPWGDAFDKGKCNTEESGIKGTSPVDTYPQGASPYGVLEMSGNVWEWTRSLLKLYPYVAKDGREDPNSQGSRVWRGGSWVSNQDYARTAARHLSLPVNRFHGLGLRLVWCVHPPFRDH